MEPPEAHINHRSPQRVRLKISSQKGNANYFDEIREKLADLQQFKELKVNPLTGSVLLVHENIDVAAIASYAKANRLFSLNSHRTNPSPLAHRAVSPIQNLNHLIRQYTGGFADLTSVLFVVLTGLGIYDIARGRPKLPPWYTAFWYAIGIIELKKFFEKSS
jgi:hypothetical protein